jgi:hypothetical protein
MMRAWPRSSLATAILLTALPIFVACGSDASDGAVGDGSDAAVSNVDAAPDSVADTSNGGGVDASTDATKEGGAGAAIGNGPPLSPYLVGQNFWYPDALASLWPVVKASGVTLIRIGGNAPNKTPPSNTQYVDWINQVRAIGAEPIVQVSNAITDVQAGELVTYLNVTRGLKIRFWGVGNEPDLDKIPVDQVGTYVRGHASAMKAADPTIQIYAPDLAWYDGAYLGPLIGGAQDITGKDANGRNYIDGVTFHTYPNGATFDRAATVASAAKFRTSATSLIASLAAADAMHGRTGEAKLRWALGEFNITYANPAANGVGDYAVTSFLNGQYFAEVYGIGMELGAQWAASWSIYEGGGTRGTGDLGYLDGVAGATEPRSSYWHTKLVADHFHGRFAAGKTNQPLVKAFGAGDGSTLAVILLNEDATTSYHFTVRLDASSAPSSSALDVGIDSALGASVSGDLKSEATAVLVFDATGKLVRRVDYSIADATAWTAPR